MFSLQSYLAKEYSVSDDEWACISKYFEEIDFPKNEYFIQFGKVCRRTGFILDGVMRYFDPDETGAEPTCFFTYEGHYILDPFTYEEQKPSIMYLKSVTNCKVLVTSYENDRKLVAEFPRWKDIKHAIVLRLSLEFSDQKALLNLSAAERYNYFIEKYPHLALRVPLQYVASYLGIAQPSLSRLRRERVKSK